MLTYPVRVQMCPAGPKKTLIRLGWHFFKRKIHIQLEFSDSLRKKCCQLLYKIVSVR